MTEERLEELIEQRGTIYIIFPECHFIKKTELNNCCFSIKNNELTELFLKTVDTYEMWRLHETREQAEWHLKNDAERTERFEPPMWEDIENSYEFRWFDKDNEVYKFYVNKYIDVIVIIKMFDCVSTFNKEATKENYEKACEMVRDLFRGENENHRR